MATIPSITTAQMREVDRLMIETYGIELIQMMENAGRHLAQLARTRFLDGDPRGRDVVVLAGRGGNGGGGLVCARRLHAWGAAVRVFTTHTDEVFRGVPAHQLGILRRVGVPVDAGCPGDTLPDAALIVDALIGYGLGGSPRGAAARLIESANAHRAPVLSLDTPSGLDTTSGERHEPSIRATATLTLALPKTGLDHSELVGELHLADIGVPPGLYDSPELDLEVGPIFAREEIIRVS
jgi:NAD(P)H-hydrate epimerase